MSQYIEYIDSSELLCREGVRDHAYVLDAALTVLAFDGIEEVDWTNLVKDSIEVADPIDFVVENFIDDNAIPEGTVRLSWISLGGSTAIYRSSDSGLNWTLISSKNPGIELHNDVLASEDYTLYSYRIRAFKGTLNSGWTSIIDKQASTRPLVVSAVVEHLTPSIITITYDKTVHDIVKEDYTITGKTISTCVVNGSIVTLTVTVPFVNGNVITFDYVRNNGNAGDVNDQSVTNNILYIPILGETYGGGVVFYIFQPGDPGYDVNHPKGLIYGGFISAVRYYFGPDTLVSGTLDALGQGKTNTDKIIVAYGAGNYSASLVRAQTYGGYNDWSAPSKDELRKWKAYYGGSTEIWTSTEVDASGAYVWSGSDMYRYAKAFTNGYNIAVRMFSL